MVVVVGKVMRVMGMVRWQCEVHWGTAVLGRTVSRSLLSIGCERLV